MAKDGNNNNLINVSEVDSDGNLYDKVLSVLQQDERFFVEDGTFLRNAVYEAAMQMDGELIRLLLADQETRKRFFREIDSVQVFDKVEFGWVINNRQFLPDSYTRFKNKIGLVDESGDFFSDSGNVELVFPYKDCVLEGGQTKEDQKRDEIFYNETLAPDEVDRLLYPKVLKVVQKNKVKEIKFDSSENLIIQGNNLLALSSLLPVYSGRVNLIYIDPPYNTGGDSFNYNDKFNHSTWLSFMKTRLELAKKILAPNGSILVHLDWNEVHYCKILMDEIFGRDCFRNEIIWCYSGPGSPNMRQLSRKHDNILWYSNSPYEWTFNGDEVRMTSEVHVGGFGGEMDTESSESYTKLGKIPEDWWELFHRPDDLFDELAQLKAQSEYMEADWIYSAVAARIKVDGKKRTGYLTEKPYKLMERLIKMASKEGDIILDFFAGSGTTGYVANRLKRKFILVEQLDDTISLLKKRFSDTSYVFLQLYELNMFYAKKIQLAKDDKTLTNIWKMMLDSGWINFRVSIKDIEVDAVEFRELSMKDKKRFLMEILDKNLLYVNYCDMDDEEFDVSEEDKAFTRSFYGEGM